MLSHIYLLYGIDVYANTCHVDLYNWITDFYIKSHMTVFIVSYLYVTSRQISYTFNCYRWCITVFITEIGCPESSIIFVSNYTADLHNTYRRSDLYLNNVNTLFWKKRLECKASHLLNLLPMSAKQNWVSLKLFKRVVNTV